MCELLSNGGSKEDFDKFHAELEEPVELCWPFGKANPPEFAKQVKQGEITEGGKRIGKVLTPEELAEKRAKVEALLAEQGESGSGLRLG